MFWTVTPLLAANQRWYFIMDIPKGCNRVYPLLIPDRLAMQYEIN
jgi:hypothetical protein